VGEYISRGKSVKRVIAAILISCIGAAMVGCRHAPVNQQQVGVTGGTDNLDELMQLSWSAKTLNKDEINGVRTKALRETAMSVGARTGLYYRAQQINTFLKRDTKRLDTIFNFYGLILEHNVLPPVLEESKTTLNLDSNDALRLSDHTYMIVDQAKFITAPPTWRDYLWMNFDKPEVPNRTLLPGDSREKAVWNQFVTEGFNNGVAQANAIYAENVERLRRDYQGMMLYRKLLAQHMVSPPYVAKTDLGVTGNNNEMRINDRMLRITALPQLDLHTKNWQAVISK
jgi:defect-in-organelle-trafficking protein DotC